MPKINLAVMDVVELLKLRSDVEAALAGRRSTIEREMQRLDAFVGGRKVPGGRRRGSLAGRKVAPKYRSRRDPSLVWSGRGAEPRWMREEMKAGKLKRDAFLIK